MGPRIWTVREANATIPALDAIFKSIEEVRHRLKKLKGKADVLEMLWGDELASESCPDHREFQHYGQELERLKLEYDTQAKRFGELEVVLKSIDSGLVDFYGVIESRLVFLCWKRGETEVEYYHQIEEGFNGRVEIAREYRNR